MVIKFKSKLGSKETLKVGVVLNEFIVDNQRHFLVRWESGEEEITSALSSKKYEYIFSK